MQSRSFAPIGRAFLFFGLMAVAVVVMTLGSGFQRVNDASSTTVAQMRMQEQSIAAERFASANPAPTQARVQQASAPSGRTAIR